MKETIAVTREVRRLHRERWACRVSAIATFGLGLLALWGGSNLLDKAAEEDCTMEPLSLDCQEDARVITAEEIDESLAWQNRTTWEQVVDTAQFPIDFAYPHGAAIVTFISGLVLPTAGTAIMAAGAREVTHELRQLEAAA